MSKLMTNIRRVSLPLQESSRQLGNLLLSLGQAADATLDAEALAALEKSAEEAAAASARAKAAAATTPVKEDVGDQQKTPREDHLASDVTDSTSKVRSGSVSTVDSGTPPQHPGSGASDDSKHANDIAGTSSSLMHSYSPSVHSVSSSHGGHQRSFSSTSGQEQQHSPPVATASAAVAGEASEVPAAAPGPKVEPPSPAATLKPASETSAVWPGFGGGVDSDKLVICESRALAHLFTRIRNRNTPPQSFKFYANRMMRILAEEGIACLESSRQFITTPTAATFSSVFVDESNVCVVSVLRAGDALADAAQACIPHAPVGKILIQRDEESPDKHPVLFYKKLPRNIGNMQVLLCDPMLATGGSALMAIRTLVESGVKVSRIVFVTVLVCPEGLAALRAEFPEITIVTGAMDDCLDERKYILPGLGDFGDRFFGTVP